MSHFTVLVVGDNPEEQLQPFHEFECTGEDDQYIQEIDETQEQRESYETQTRTRYKDATGKLHDPYKNEFYREMTDIEKKEHGPFFGTGGGGGISWSSRDWGDGKGYRAKVHMLPEGYTEVEVPCKQIESFQHFLEDWIGKKCTTLEDLDLKDEHKFGYALVDEKGTVIKVVDRTNPNAKWDWHQLGGRWTGFFKLKQPKFLRANKLTQKEIKNLANEYGVAQSDIVELSRLLKDGNINKVYDFRKGSGKNFTYQLEKAIQALLTPQYATATAGTPGLGAAPAKDGWADSALKRDIDFEGMREHDAEEARKRWLRLERLMGKIVPLSTTWAEVCDDKGAYKDKSRDERRNFYHSQEPLVKIKVILSSMPSGEDRDFLTWIDYSDYACSLDKYVEGARNAAVSTHAVVKDGKWYEKGEMGWWGVVHDEKNQDAWDREFNKLLVDISSDTLLSMYDCHI